jgi:hypothetical protein
LRGASSFVSGEAESNRMPWTFAHPAAVLPLKWLVRPLPLAALVTGSLMPDAAYSFGLFGLSTLAHSVLGALIVCMPLGALLLAGFQRVRQPIVFLLPQPHRGALTALPQRRCFGSLAAVGWTLLALVFGAWTHIAWDACTHTYGSVVLQWPWLRQIVTLGPFGAAPVFKLVQHGSTLAGLTVLLLAYARWLRRQPIADEAVVARDERRRTGLVAGLLVASLSVALAVAFLVVGRHAGALAVPTGALWFRVAVIAPVVFALLLSGTALIVERQQHAAAALR